MFWITTFLACSHGVSCHQKIGSGLKKKQAAFQAVQGGTLTVALGPLSKIMSDPPNRKILIEEFEKGLKRAVMSEGHELLLWYCEQTHQVDIYRSESWFQFARIIRNTVSHKQGGTLREWPHDLKKNGIIRVSWRDRIIDENMIGEEIQFSHAEALQLLKDQINFVENSLV